MGKCVEITIGERFYRWTLIEEVDPLYRNGKYERRMVRVECECGRVRIVALGALRQGRTKSCGCAGREKSKIRFQKHGLRYLPVYRVYSHIMARCHNENAPNYKWYGARGVSVCREWRNHPAVFLEWALNNGYTEGLQIDRIDNDGNYEPGNCRFVTNRDNQRNKSTTKLTAKKVREIKALRQAGHSFQKIGATLGVNRKTASDAFYGKTWSDVK